MAGCSGCVVCLTSSVSIFTIFIPRLAPIKDSVILDVDDRHTLNLLHAHSFVILLEIVVVASAESGDGDSGGGAWTVLDHGAWMLLMVDIGGVLEGWFDGGVGSLLRML